MTYEELLPVFTVLALQLHATDADEPTAKAYHAGLADLEPEFVAEAARRFAAQTNQDGQAWFPKLPEWRRSAILIEREWQEQQKAMLRRLPAPLCEHCHDTGWKRIKGGRVHRCDCTELRRLELLGRQPLPKQLVGRT